MQLATSTFIWVSPFSSDRLDLFARAARLGSDVLEICIEDPALVHTDEIAEAAAGAGIGISVCGAFGPSRDVSSEDPEVRAQGLEYLGMCIDIAAALSSPLVSGPMYSATGKTRLLAEEARKQQRGWAADGIRRAADYAAVQGVRLAVEPLNRYETDLVNTVSQGMDLCEQVGRDNVGLLLDTFHMNIEEKNIADAIRLGGDRLFELHACENDRGTPGSGHVEWGDVFDAVVQVGFDGLIALEAFTPEIEEIARAVSMWRPVAASGDALVEDGLRFLRSELGARGVTFAAASATAGSPSQRREVLR
jgi:D-psicose/D-tagatose/L-ribulose 3-epimerase